MARDRDQDDGTEKARASEVQPMIPQRKLRELLKTIRTGAENVSEITGSVGSAIRTAMEKWGVDRTALGMIKRLDKMSPERLANTMDQFEYMYEQSGLAERAKQAPRLEMGEEEPASAEKPHGANVSPLRQPVAAE